MSDAPTEPKKLQQLKAMIAEITYAYRDMDDKREQVKEIVKAASDEFSIKKTLITKIARTMYKHNYADIQAEQEEFELLYESVVDAQATPTLSAVSND